MSEVVNTEEELGELYVVATPIGNIEDISYRAVRILKSVDFIAAEDTRHSRYLLDTYNIDTPVFSVHEHNEQNRVLHIERLLREGKSLALISDAGTPLISDPGFRLINHLVVQGLKVRTVPGPCAAIAALSISGLPSDRFYFEGFLPSKGRVRIERLRSLGNLGVTVVLYESPHRLIKLLEEIAEVFGEETEVCVARELTKKFEELSLKPCLQLLHELESGGAIKGEHVVLIPPIKKPGQKEGQVDGGVMELLVGISGYVPLKEACSLVSNFTGVSKNRLYKQYLLLKP